MAGVVLFTSLMRNHQAAPFGMQRTCTFCAQRVYVDTSASTPRITIFVLIRRFGWMPANCPEIFSITVSWGENRVASRAMVNNGRANGGLAVVLVNQHIAVLEPSGQFWILSRSRLTVRMAENNYLRRLILKRLVNILAI